MQQPGSSRSQLTKRVCRGGRAGGLTAVGSPSRSQSHPCKCGTAQTLPCCCPGAAVNTSKGENQWDTKAPVPTCSLPGPRAAQPGSLWATEPWTAQGCFRKSLLQGCNPVTASCTPDANLPKPTFRRGCASGGRAGPQTPAPLPADAVRPGPVVAVTLPACLRAARRPRAEMGSCIKHPWPEIQEKTRQLIINSGASPEEWKSIPHHTEVVQDVEASTVPGSSAVT